ncbi:hypothetical protein JCM10213_009058 [Rhodosporidiobolus nylandii]
MSINGAVPVAPFSPAPSTSSAAAPPAQQPQEPRDLYADLASHLLAGWTNADFSDCQLHVQYADASQGIFHVHGLVISQSPLLKTMLIPAYATSPRPTLLLSFLDPLISAASLGLCLASLYSPSVLSHLSSTTAPSVLATASFLGLERLAALAFEQCEASVSAARTAEDVDFWISYVERERGFPPPAAAGTPQIPGSPVTGPGGPTPPASVNGKAAAPPAGYEARLRALLLERIVRLPKELGAFDVQKAAQTQPVLIDVLKRLPFEVFKSVVEDSRFEAPSDMDRFNFAKKAIAARKAHFLSASAASPASASLPPPDFEETVVLQFGQAGPGQSAVSVLRKQRKPQLWKVGGMAQ